MAKALAAEATFTGILSWDYGTAKLKRQGSPTMDESNPGFLLLRRQVELHQGKQFSCFQTT